MSVLNSIELYFSFSICCVDIFFFMRAYVWEVEQQHFVFILIYKHTQSYVSKQNETKVLKLIFASFFGTWFVTRENNNVFFFEMKTMTANRMKNLILWQRFRNNFSVWVKGDNCVTHWIFHCQRAQNEPEWIKLHQNENIKSTTRSTIKLLYDSARCFVNIFPFSSCTPNIFETLYI